MAKIQFLWHMIFLLSWFLNPPFLQINNICALQIDTSCIKLIFCCLDFRDSCFASTQCKVHSPGEGWSLAPFCGASKCVKLESGRLAEEVTDCGPVVDLELSPGCQLVKDGADPKADFPACCPVYDCEEGTQVKYVKTPAQKKKEAEAAAAAAAASLE